MSTFGFFAELSNLKRLYFVTLRAQQLFAANIKQLSHGEELQPILSKKYDPKLNVPHHLDAKAFLKKDAALYLREVIFVRLMSAVEVMLIDYAYNLLSANRMTLLGKKVEIDTNLLTTFSNLDDLWSKIIKDECRNLNGRKFSDVTEYFQRKFDLKLQSFAEHKQIEEMYDRRNILVHALGQTDEAYRKKYSYDSSFLSVDESYLMKVFSLLEDFHSLLRRLTFKKLNHSQPLSDIKRNYQVKVNVRIIDEAAAPLFSPELRIPSSSGDAILSDLVKNKVASQNDVGIVLSGSKPIIGKYIELLKKAEFEKLLQITRREVLSRGHRSQLSNETLQKIYARLGPRPWPRGVRDDIASEFEISKSQVTYAIDLIYDYEDHFKNGAATD